MAHKKESSSSSSPERKRFPFQPSNLMSVKYRSTRGDLEHLSFEQVVLGGLAEDKGLYIPEVIPKFTATEIDEVYFFYHCPFIFSLISDLILKTNKS